MSLTIEAHQLVKGDEFTTVDKRVWHSVVEVEKRPGSAVVLVRTSTSALVTLPWKEPVTLAG